MAEVFGIGDLAQQFEKLAANIDKTARSMVVAAGAVVRAEAKANAQRRGLRRTGALINNIAIKRQPTEKGVAQYHLGVRHGRNISWKKKGDSKLVVKGGRISKRYENDPFYWRFHELGTQKETARPFIAPALESKRTQAVDAMKRPLQRELKRQS